MGLITEVEELKNEYKQAQKDKAKAIKEAEKLAKKLEKEKEEKQQFKNYEKDLYKAIENDLKDTFQRCFERDGLNKGYINLCLKETRDEILNNVPESDIEYHYINDNYEKILEKVKKIYENDQKAKQTLLQAELLEQQKKQQQEKDKTKKIITIFFILFNPITIIIYMLIWGYFAFAKPVLKENENLGYNQFETVFINNNTNEKIPQNQIYNHFNSK